MPTQYWKGLKIPTFAMDRDATISRPAPSSSTTQSSNPSNLPAPGRADASNGSPRFWIEVPAPLPDRDEYILLEGPMYISSGTESSDEQADDAEGEEETLQLQEILGEYTWDDGETYLYARLRSEVVRKVCYLCRAASTSLLRTARLMV